MTTDTTKVDSETDKMLELSESELEAALGSLGLHGEPKDPAAKETVAAVAKPASPAAGKSLTPAPSSEKTAPAKTAVSTPEVSIPEVTAPEEKSTEVTSAEVAVSTETDPEETAPEVEKSPVTETEEKATPTESETETVSAKPDSIVEPDSASAATADTDATAPSSSLIEEPVRIVGESNSHVTGEISEKLEQTIKMARGAIESGEFVSARKLLDEVPVNRRTPEINELYEQSQGMMEFDQLWLKAKKFVQKEEYVEAVETLESIPEDLRTKQMTNMLNVAQNQATVTLAIRAAKEKLTEYQYKSAIEVLEGVPKERRSDGLIDILRDTYRITRRLDDLRLEGESRFQKSIMAATMEHLDREENDSFEKVLEIYEEILTLCPIDEEARDRAEKATNYLEMAKQREELEEYARLHLEEKHYRDALECLQKIHPDVQTGPIREQVMELEGIIERIDELRIEILQNFDDSEFCNTADSFEKLKELHEGEYDRLLKEILGGGLEGALNKVFQKVKDSDKEDPSLVALLDYLMKAIKQEDFEDLLVDSDDTLLDHYPASGNGLYQKLVKILSALTEEPARFSIRFSLLKRYRQHLKEAEPNLTAWEEILEALEQFEQLQTMPWNLKDRWLENDHTNMIEMAAFRVADTANCALPQCEDRWQRLVNVAGAQLGFDHAVSRILYKQIENYLKHGSWSGKKICLITRRMAMVAGLGGIGSIVMLELVKINYDIFIKAGGFSAVLAAFLLFLIWGTFCILAHRWIEE
ncbi:hypothetical protein Pla110_39300 [Polystyrenella longa]|uniref:Uncharacterized protein n=1 Tax=Polystyrenella longa TaxID=2528007 RepID=A0A518CSI2_9PLAN|nr:hypothetical protein [Polystyrenella longa]QDU82175.1 hypothetical protein Pla110_39300 [Polystyrenella longa]